MAVAALPPPTKAPSGPAAAGPPAAPSLKGGSLTVTVQPGETLYGLAERHKVTPRAIIDANRLEPPFLLQAGQRITIPQPREHVVQGGETLEGIARTYGVETVAVAAANGLIAPYTIKAGQRLTIPEPTGGRPAPIAAAPAKPRAEPAAVASVPAAKEPAAKEKAPTPIAIAPPPSPLAPKPETAPAPPPQAALPPEKEPQGAAPAPVVSGPGFQWPVQGRVVSTFGTKGGGNRNDGINIAAARGTPVKAAQKGLVAYAGNEVRGFGNLILIRHADGWVTAYAHNDKLLVKKGDTVAKGQVIAEVGTTGGVSEPQLHFEMRKGTTAVDPTKHLEGSS